MTDTAPADTATEPEATPDATDTDSTDWKAEAEKAKALQRKWEDRAKANSKAATELEELRKSHMTETEKAIEQAKAEGRAEALAEAGSKVARAEFKAALGDRLDADGFEALMAGLDLAAFLNDQGDVDAEKITAFVDRIAPRPTEDTFAPIDMGQGARTTGSMPLNGDPILDTVKQKLGIR